MAETNVEAALAGAYQTECRSLLTHLGGAAPFVDWASADDVELVRRLIAEEQEHRRWLVDALSDRGAAPPPCAQPTEAGALAYLKLDFLLSRVIRDKRDRIGSHERHAARAAGDATASTPMARILERSRRHLAALERLQADAQRGSPAG